MANKANQPRNGLTAIILTPAEAVRVRLHECLDALKQRLAPSIRPIYASTDGEKLAHVGSCVLVELHGASVIATAAHVIDENKQASLYVAGMNGLVAIEGDFWITVAPKLRDADRYDFAVGELSPEKKQKLGNVKWLTPDIKRQVPQKGHVYAVFGYPRSKNKKVDNSRRVIRPALWQYANVATSNPPFHSGRKPTQNHIYLAFGKQSRDAQGAVVNSPHPRGVSGGAILDMGNFGDPNNLDPNAECGDALVGLFIEKHGGYVIGTMFSTIVAALKTKGIDVVFPEQAGS
jgi:hypothetical protein